MPEKPNEGNLNGAEGQDASQPLTPEQISSLQASLVDANKTIADLTKERSSLQSTKDKGINKIEAEIARIATYLNIKPEDVAQAQRTAILDDIVRERQTPSNPPVGNGIAEGATALDAQKVITEYGLDANDPEVLKTLLHPTPIIALGKLAIARAKTPSQTNAQTPPVEGQSPPANLTEADLRKQYQQEIAKIPRGRIKELSTVQAKYRQLGLKV
jgi:hypothetical protein